MGDASVEHITGQFLYDLLNAPRIRRKFARAIRFTSQTNREAGFEVYREFGKGTIVYRLVKGDNRRLLTAPEVLYRHGVYDLFNVHTHPLGDEPRPSAEDLAYLKFCYDGTKKYADVSVNPVGGILYPFKDPRLFSLVLYQFKDPEEPPEKLDELRALEKRIAELQDSRQDDSLLHIFERADDNMADHFFHRYLRLGALFYRFRGKTPVLDPIATDFLSEQENTTTPSVLLDAFSFSAHLLDKEI